MYGAAARDDGVPSVNSVCRLAAPVIVTVTPASRLPLAGSVTVLFDGAGDGGARSRRQREG